MTMDYFEINGEQPRAFKLKDLCLAKLGMEMVEKPREVLESDWSSVDLSDDEVNFSCLDAFVCYRVSMSLCLNAGFLCEALLFFLERGPPSP